MVQIDRDPNSKKLEIDVMGQLSDIFKTFEPEKKPDKSNEVSFVSLEDAIKELLAMGEKI